MFRITRNTLSTTKNALVLLPDLFIDPFQIKELTGIVAKTTIYSTEEKEKLKDMFATYQKDEKDILKAQRKGLKVRSLRIPWESCKNFIPHSFVCVDRRYLTTHK